MRKLIHISVCFGSVFIVQIILTLSAKRKMNLVSSSILGIHCGGFVGVFLLDLGKA
jgi:hypothetical protein